MVHVGSNGSDARFCARLLARLANLMRPAGACYCSARNDPHNRLSYSPARARFIIDIRLTDISAAPHRGLADSIFALSL